MAKKLTFSFDEQEDVRQRIARARTYCKPWHEQIEKRRKLYNNEHYTGEPKKGETRYVDPTYRNTVDLGIGIMLGNEMKWHAIGWTPDNQTQTETDKVEKYLMGVIAINNFREESNIPYEIYKSSIRDGMQVLYSVWDKKLALKMKGNASEPDEESPTAKKSFSYYKEPPILAQVIDPLKMVMLQGGHKRWSMQACIDSVNVYDVEKKYGITVEQYARLTDEEKAAQNTDLIDYWDFWEDKNEEVYVRHAILCNDEFVVPLTVADGYEDLPYTINFYQPIDKNDPKNWGSSIIDPLVPEVELLEKNVNRRQKQIDVYSSLPMMARSANGKKITFDPGTAENVISLEQGDEIAFPVWPGNPPDTREQIDLLRARVQQSGFSDVMMGSSNSQISGYALSQLGDQNRIRLEQPVTHLELFWSQWAKKILSLTAVFAKGSRVRVSGRIHGQDFVNMVQGEGIDQYLVNCEIKPDFPNEKVRNHAMATQVAGILDDGTIMENYLGIEQPSDVQEKKIAQNARNNPIMMQYALIKQFRTMAESGDKDAALTLKLLETQMQSVTQQVQPSRNPEQLQGVQSPNGEATPQAQGQQPYGQGEAAMIQDMAGMSPQMTTGMVQ